jgi:hypothetical protein
VIARLLIATAGLAHAAAAQSPSFQYYIQAPASLNPGQTATITVLCGFSPGVGQPVTGGTVLGLASGAFSVLGSSGGWSANQLIAPYNFLPPASAGIISGSNVNFILWGNGFGPPLGTVSTVNPTPIWQATFTMGLSAAAITVNRLSAHGIWCMPTGGTIAFELSSTAVQGAQIVILPAPSSFALLAAAGLIASRRRRRFA